MCPSGQPTEKRKALRIVSRCSTKEEWIAVFRKLYRNGEIFIATKNPKPANTKLRFRIVLADGTEMVAGTGVVTRSDLKSLSPFKRPGMFVRPEELGDEGRKVFELLAIPAPRSKPDKSQKLASLTKVPGVKTEPKASNRFAVPKSIPAVSASPTEEPSVEPPKQPSLGADVTESEVTPLPERVQGSAYVLPANPFGGLDASALEAFVECTLYEENSPLADPEGVLEGFTELDGAEPIADGTLASENPSAATEQQPVASVSSSSTTAGGEEVRRRHSAQTVPPEPRAPALPPAANAPTGAMSPQHHPHNQPAAMENHQYAGWDSTAVIITNSRKKWWIGGGLAATIAAISVIAAQGGTTQTAQVVAMNDDAKGPATTGESPAKVVASAPALPSTRDAGDAGSTVVLGSGDAGLADAATPQAVDPSTASAFDGGTTDLSGHALAVVGCTAVISSTPAGANVFLEGAAVGKTPLTQSFPCGDGTLTLRRSRYAPAEIKFDLVAGQTAELKAKLKRPTHTLRIDSTPRGATVRVNGRRVGKTPVSARVSGFEKARVRLTKAGYRPWSKLVYAKKPRGAVKVALRRARRKRRSTR